jgi:prepilin-type N-terminal cleavage/methylation domain-containing protein
MQKVTKKQNGFTVVEMIVAMFILTIIGTAVVNFQLDIFSLNKINSSNLVIQESARLVLKNISSEIRSMSPSSIGAYNIDQAATSSLTFYSNIDSDPSIEKIRYFLSGTTLKKGVTKPVSNIYNPANETFRDLAQNVANATSTIFSYYDSTYDGTSAPLSQPIDILKIRLIKVNLVIDQDLLKSPPPLYMTTQVSIRNLKDNL